jgi:hypothetical protein
VRKAVLSISGNVYKQQEMEIDKLINDASSPHPAIVPIEGTVLFELYIP